MCYYDVYHFACHDWEWGGLVSHCENIGRPGHYCTGNLAANIITNTEPCPCCQQLNTHRKKVEAMEQEWWNFSFVGGNSRHEKRLEGIKSELRALEQEISEMRWRKEGSRFAMMGSMKNLAQEHAARQKDVSPYTGTPHVVTSLYLPPPATVVSPPSPTTSLSSSKGPESMLSRSSSSTASSGDRELKLVSTWEDDDSVRPPKGKTVGWLRKRWREYADELKRDMSFDDV